MPVLVFTEETYLRSGHKHYFDEGIIIGYTNKIRIIRRFSKKKMTMLMAGCFRRALGSIRHHFDNWQRKFPPYRTRECQVSVCVH